jgi:hypothetical protein
LAFIFKKIVSLFYQALPTEPFKTIKARVYWRIRVLLMNGFDNFVIFKHMRPHFLIETSFQGDSKALASKD